MSEENEVPSDEEILKHITCEAVVFCTYKHPCGTCKGTLIRIKKLLSALRASWEKEKEELESRVIHLEYQLEHGKESREIVTDFAPLQETVLIRNKLADVLAEKQALEAEKKGLEAELDRWKLEPSYMEGFKDCRLNEVEPLKDSIDSLTLALAEAREILQKNSDEWHDFNKIEPGHSCEAKIRLHAISQRSTLGLSNPTSQRASEEMKALRKVVQEARKSCACGARGESMDTHPHVGGCELGKAFEDYDKNRGAV